MKKTLSHSEGKVKDGMDISIVSLENLSPLSESSQTAKITYARAMNPLYYVQNQEFTEIKADKKPIDANFSYQKHEILLSKKTMLYLLSDGFQDQFGGTENRKFMVKKLKNLLLEISEKPIEEQKQLLEQTFEEWKGTHKQTDDVLILGIRI